MKAKLLLIEDDDSFVDSIRLALKDRAVEVVWAETGMLGVESFRKDIHSFATVIIDYRLPDILGSDVAKLILKLNPVQDLLFASGYQDPAYLIDLLEAGHARTFLSKGKPIAELREKILESITLYENQNRVLGLDEYSPSKIELELKCEGFIGRSPGMHKVLKTIQKYRPLSYPILIRGETGVGKELVARALTPKGKNLITVNCARYTQSEQLLESELFGHVKGAFTGATHDKPGLLSQAHGQVFFLDELHHLSPASQGKLLRVLQDQKFRRVGDHYGPELSVKFRLVCATQTDMTSRIDSGAFQDDLFHRVSQLEIRVPPLRDRTEDIEPLVRQVQDEFNHGKGDGEQRQIRISTIKEMAKLPWKGNVRELQNIAKRLLANAESDIINPSELDRALGTETGRRGIQHPSQTSLGQATRQFETEQIKQVLKQCKTQAETANRLGIDPSTLLRKMMKLGINPESYLVKT